MKTVLILTLISLSTSSYAEFIGCWDTTQLGIVKGNKTFLINRGPTESLWLNSNKKTAQAILNYAALSPVNGWTICIDGDMKESEVNVTDALICTHDETVGVCDPKSKIADSRLF
jgi:hypothetical protein